MDGMDTTIQNGDDMDVDGDNFPLDIDHDGTLVLSICLLYVPLLSVLSCLFALCF